MRTRETDVRSIVDLSVEALKSKKGEDILVMDLRGLTDIVDYFVLATGNSDTQVKALADAVLERLETEGLRPWHVEGYESRKWVLVDAVDVVVHVFVKSAREFYRLDRLWGDAKMDWVQEEDAVGANQTSNVGEVV